MPLLLLLIGLVLPAFARSTTRWPETGLMVDRWTTEDGLPINHIRGLDVSPAGFVWMATLDGLVRFDGQHFRSFRRSELPELPSNRFLNVVVGDDEQPWASSEEGALVHLAAGRVQVWEGGEGKDGHWQLWRTGGRSWAGRDGRLYRIGAGGPVEVPGLPVGTTVLSLAEVDGTLWVGLDRGGVWRVPEDGPASLVPGSASLEDVRDLEADPAGGAWIAAKDGLWRADARGLRADTPARGEGPACAISLTDRLWVRDPRGWWSWEPGQQAWIEIPTRAPSSRATAIGALTPQDRQGPVVREEGSADLPGASCDLDTSEVLDGQVWRAVGSDLFRGASGALHLGGWGAAIRAGPDGAVWVGTNAAGLYRLRAPSVEIVGDPHLNLQSVLLASDGTYWARIWGGPLIHLGADGAPLGLPDTVARRAEGGVGLGQGPDGRVWISSGDAVCVVAGEGCDDGDPARPPESFNGQRVTRDGRVWIGFLDGLHVGEAVLGAWRWRSVPLLARGGEVGLMALVEAPDGAIWVGTRGDGVLRVTPEGVRQWARGDGLSSDTVRGIWPGPDGAAWVGTEDAGLCRVGPERGAVVCLGMADGLFDDAIHTVSADAFGRLWMSSNRGIFWVELAQLEDFAAGRRASVVSLGLVEADGMALREANGGFMPAVGLDARGRLYYPTQGGLARVDPASVRAPSPPAVFLDELFAAGEPVLFARSAPITLAPDQRELVARWTAPASAWTEQVRFRHRLVGMDAEWSAPTPAREARWTNLPPGALRLEVQAALGGDWGPPATLSMVRQPAFVETTTFHLSLVAGGLALGGLLLVWLSARNSRRRAELEAVVASRTAALADTNRDLAAHAERLAVSAQTEAAQALLLREQADVLEQQNRELAAASARLAEVDALRTRLIADLSHELRTPLTLIAGPLADLAASRVLLADPERHTLDVVLRNAQRMEHLVEQLLDITRLESGKIPLRVRHRDLGAFLRELAGRFEPECRRKRLALELDLAPAPADLFFDGEILEKVVSNLLTNAVKFTPPGGVIRLALRRAAEDESAVRVEVCDTGEGVSDALRERLFDRFVQGERGDARRFEGVGIGLALARDLVNLHGGEIGVESAPGQGSRFWFTLPCGVDHLAPEDVAQPSGLAPPPAPEVDAPPPAEEPASPRPEVLVVEDHQDMRDFLVAHLRKRFQVRAAASGPEALELARAAPPAAIVSDVMMPGMDGLELCRRLDADPALREIPVLLASAKASEDDRVRGLEVADDYMTKPLRMRELLVRVQKLVDGATGRAAADAEGVGPAPSAAPVDGLSAADLALRARIEATIARNLADADFGVEQLARALAFSRRQLLREVQRVTGQSPSDLLRALRMEEGHRLLVEGKVSTVGEAAAQVGLSLPYFSRTYTAWYKRPPSELLRRGRV